MLTTGLIFYSHLMHVCIYTSVKHEFNISKKIVFDIVIWASICSRNLLVAWRAFNHSTYCVKWHDCLAGMQCIWISSLMLHGHHCFMFARDALMRPTWFGRSGETSPVRCGSFANFVFYWPVSICASSASRVQVADWSSD